MWNVLCSIVATCVGLRRCLFALHALRLAVDEYHGVAHIHAAPPTASGMLSYTALPMRFGAFLPCENGPMIARGKKHARVLARTLGALAGSRGVAESLQRFKGGLCLLTMNETLSPTAAVAAAGLGAIVALNRSKTNLPSRTDDSGPRGS